MSNNPVTSLPFFGRIQEPVCACAEGYMYLCMDGWMDGRMDGWIHTHTYTNKHTNVAAKPDFLD